MITITIILAVILLGWVLAFLDIPTLDDEPESTMNIDYQGQLYERTKRAS